MTISLPSRTAPDHQMRSTGDTIARWKTYLTGVPVDVDLPGVGTGHAGAFQPSSVPVPVSSAVATAMRDYEGGWLAAFVALLCRFTGQREIVVGCPEGDRLTARSIPAPSGSFTEAINALGEPDCEPIQLAEFATLLGRRPDAGPVFTVGYVRGDWPRPWPEATLSLLVKEGTDGAMIGYHAGVLDAAQAGRLAAHLATLVTNIIGAPDARLSSHELLPQEERARILRGFNETAVEHTDERGFSERIRDVAVSTPQAVALSSRSVELSYAELDRRANQLARHLADNGVARGSFVGILLERSIDAAVATLAVLRTGAAAVPLDPADNDEWIAYMIRDSAPTAVVTDNGLAGRLPAGRLTVRAAATPPVLIRLDADAERIAAQPGTDLGVNVEPSEISHVVYTSGSTGVPKGALATHRTLINLMNWMPSAYEITAESRASWLCTPGFAIGRMEWMPFLAAGAQVHIADAITVGSVTRIRDWLLDNEITHTLMVTSLAQRVCATQWPAEPALRFVIVLGEPLRRWPQRDLPFQVCVSYGSTEVAVATSSYDSGRGLAETSASTPPEALADSRPSVGRPIANARIYVLDEERLPVPLGTVGEIYIAGDGVCTSYLNLNAETAERFVPNTLPEEQGKTLFRTGDLGRWRHDGLLDVIGRQDAQTWIRGMRVEVGEVEAVIAGLREVREVAVVAKGGELIGYVVPTNLDTWSAEDVLTGIRHRLPAHQAPRQLIALDRLPRLANGKLDRQQLPDPGRQIELITDEDARFEPFALTAAQQLRLSGHGHRHGFWEWESEELDPDRFALAWERVLARHDALRTVVHGDGTQQVLDDPPPYEIEQLDLRGLPDAEAGRLAEQVRTEMNARTATDGTFPLWDVRLTRLPGNRVRVHLLLDLLIADPVSYYQVLVSELVAFYHDAEAELALPRLRFRDYAVSVAAADESNEDGGLSEQAWRERVASLASGPTFSGSGGAGKSEEQHCHRVTAQRWSVLKDRAAAGSISATGIVLAAFGEVLRAFSDSERFTVQVPLCRRFGLHPDIERVIGDFTTSVLVDMRSGGNFADRAKAAESQLAAEAERIEVSSVGARAVAAEVERGGPSLLSVTMTSLLNQSIRQVRTALGTAVHASIQTPFSVLDLQVLQIDGALHLGWNSTSGALPDGMLAEMSTAMAGVLDRLIDDADCWLWEQLLPTTNR